VKETANAPGTSSKSQALKAVLSLIEAPLEIVERRIREQARSFDPAVEGYVAFAIESNGKRLRPALTLLCAGATGNTIPEHTDLAVVIELIHAATLVHDDILDGADKRRGQPTANAKWGNSLSVLLGDCLFAHALKLSSDFDDREIGRRIASAANEVCTGEIIQTQRKFDLTLSIPDYYRIIAMKTGALFAAASELSALLNHAPAPAVEAFRLLGMRLGTAYQIYDDCLDLAGDEAQAGKSLGSDLRKGKLTLPVLHLLDRSSTAERHSLSEIILKGSDADLQSLVLLTKESGALADAITAGQSLLQEAGDCLSHAKENACSAALAELLRTLDEMLARFAP